MSPDHVGQGAKNKYSSQCLDTIRPKVPQSQEQPGVFSNQRLKDTRNESVLSIEDCDPADVAPSIAGEVFQGVDDAGGNLLVAHRN